MTADKGTAPRWARIALVAILALDVWLRGHTFGPDVRDRLGVTPWPVVSGETEPLDCDEAAYAYIGRRLVAGDVLYRDLTENKPPLGYWMYALAVRIGGARELTIRIMPIPLVLATIALVWRIGLRLAGPGAACLGAFTIAIASTDPYVFGNGANLEHAINLFATASLALMVDAIGRGGLDRGRWRLLGAGMFGGAASLVKQVAALHLPVYAVALMVRSVGPDRPRGARSRLLDLMALGLGFGLAWGLAAGLLWSRGAGASAFDDIVRYGGALATDTPPDPHAPPFLVRWIAGNADPTGALPWPFGSTDYLVWWGAGTWPLWIAGGFALARYLLGPAGAGHRLVAAWTLSAWVQVALPRLFWQHYYMLPLPGLALLVGLAGSEVATRCRSAFGSRRFAGAGLAAILGVGLAASLGGTVALQVRDYLLVPAERLTVDYKGGGQWVALRDLGRELARRLGDRDDPRLFVWGWQSPLFFYSGFDGVSPHFFADPLLKAFAETDHPLIRPRIERIRRDLRDRPPELIFAGDPPFPALRAFLSERYRPAPIAVRGQVLPIAPDGRGLWVERSSADRFLKGPWPTPDQAERSASLRTSNP